MWLNLLIFGLSLCGLSAKSGVQKEQLDELFANCRRSHPDFDSCVQRGLNEARVFFRSGVPAYNIGPFDPFFMRDILQVRETGFGNYKLVLNNVTESGWTDSRVTRFKTNFNKYLIQYTQNFPDKKLKGYYKIDGTLFGMRFKNKGKFTLNLYDLTQTTTVIRKPIKHLNNTWNFQTKLKVMVDVQTIGNMSLHVSNLANNRPVIENFIDMIINSTWKTGFPLFRQSINDLVSTAFTEIMNTNFKNFPFEQFFKN